LIISEIRPQLLPSTVLPIQCHWTHHQHHHTSESAVNTTWHTFQSWMDDTVSIHNCECCNSAIVDRRKGWPPEHKTLILWNVTNDLGHGCFLIP